MSDPRVTTNVLGVGRISFWCLDCRIDLDLAAERIKARDGDEFWRARCDQCHRTVVRLITHPLRDPYFKLSEKVRKLRSENAKDFNTASQFTYGQEKA